MLILFLIVFIDLVGFGIVIPLLPFYAEYYQASPDVVVLVLAAYSAAQFVSAPFWGRLSDRIGRRPVLLVTLAGVALSYIWLAFADSLAMLFAARLFSGLMAGNIATAFAYMADITTPANRAKGMGLVGAAFGIGFILGPAIGGVLAGNDPEQANFQLPALVAAAFSLVAFAMAVVRLPESLSEEIRARLAALPRRTRWQQFREALARPNVALLIALSFLATFVFAGMETTFAMWSRRQFGWGPEQNGWLFAFLGCVSAVIQGGLIGRLTRRFGEPALILQGSVAFALGLLLLPFSNTLPMLVVSVLVLTYGYAVMSPPLNSLISQNVGAEEQGGIFGVTRSATTMARIVGPAWAGVLFAQLGKEWPYFGGAAVMLGVIVLATRIRRRASAGEAG